MLEPLLLAALSIGGTPAGPARGDSTGQFVERTHAGADGPVRYKLYIPAGYDGSSPRPLLVMLHGCTQNADDFARGTRMNALAETETVLVAYPEQTATANAQRCWNWYDPAHQSRGTGEPELVAGITRDVMREMRVDPARVYVAGVSAGGAMALTVATAYPELFAAVGVHSGVARGAARGVPAALAAMRSGAKDTVAVADAVRPEGAPARALPAIVFHGAADAVVSPVNGRQVRDQLLLLAGIDAGAGSTTTAADSGGMSWTVTRFTGPGGATLVESWEVDGLGHAWSGGSPEGSFTDARGPDASREMLRFFLAHPRREGGA